MTAPVPSDIDGPAGEDQLALYRDIFAEITAKATPLEFAPDDPERITAYRVPCGPLHRAAGKLGFQMFDGERHLADAIAKIAELEALLYAGDGVEDWT